MTDECPHGLQADWCTTCLHGVDESRLTVSRRPAKPPRLYPRQAGQGPGRWGELGVDPRYRGDGSLPDYDRGFAPRYEDRRFSRKATFRENTGAPKPFVHTRSGPLKGGRVGQARI